MSCLFLSSSCIVLPSPCIAADWVRIDIFPEDERELPNIFLDFGSFKERRNVTVITARLVNPDSSYVELMVKINCTTDQFDVPRSTFYSREGKLANREALSEPQWLSVPQGSHIEFIKFCLCKEGTGKSEKEFRRMRAFRDFVIMSRLAAKGEAP